MEEAIVDALAEAGQALAEAVRAALASSGLPSVLNTSVLDGRVTVASVSPEVHRAERGGLGAPPTAPIETAARAAAREVVCLLQSRLQETLR